MLRPFRFAMTLAALALAACALAPSLESKTGARQASSSPDLAMMPVKEWPLRFRSHSFSAYCFETYGCKVWYAGHLQLEQDDRKLRPASSVYGPDYRRHWSGSHLMIRNFPEPAEVSWRSKDGQTQHALIDIGALFEDGIVRHNVTRGEMADVPDGTYIHEPAILMEVNDRTIRIYMRAHISMKELQKPGNPYSDYRNDLILVRTYQY